MKWRIYYGDGSTRDYIDGPPPGLQNMEAHFGVQVILQYRHDDRLHMLHGHDFYVLDVSGYWVPVDRDSLIERLMFHRDSIVSVCKGLAIPLPQYQAIYDQAKADKDREALD